VAAEVAVVEAAVAAVVEAAVAVAASGDVQAVAVAVLALEDAEGVEVSAVAAAGGEAAAEVAVCRGEVATTARRSPRHDVTALTTRAREGHLWPVLISGSRRAARSAASDRRGLDVWLSSRSGPRISRTPGLPFDGGFKRGGLSRAFLAAYRTA
jgi:hypothetical protein